MDKFPDIIEKQTKIRIEPDSILFLRKLQRMEYIQGNILNTSKEIAGYLDCEIDRKNNIHNLKVNRESIIAGKSHEVEITPGFYNFHTHPTHVNNIHKKEHPPWPTSQDYIGFLLAFKEDNTRLHIIATRQGIYLITINKVFAKKIKKNSDKILAFIDENYDMCSLTNATPQYYTKLVNSIIYKDDNIFDTYFLSWSEANQIIYLNFSNM